MGQSVSCAMGIGNRSRTGPPHHLTRKRADCDGAYARSAEAVRFEIECYGVTNKSPRRPAIPTAYHISQTAKWPLDLSIEGWWVGRDGCCQYYLSRNKP